MRGSPVCVPPSSHTHTLSTPRRPRRPLRRRRRASWLSGNASDRLPSTRSLCAPKRETLCARPSSTRVRGSPLPVCVCVLRLTVVWARAVKAQATDDIYEPVGPDGEAGSPRGAGKKWAAAFTEEDRERRLQREQERQQEIEAAKDNYKDHANEAVQHALTKEELQLQEERRQADIAAHQATLRRENNLGGLAALDDPVRLLIWVLSSC